MQTTLTIDDDVLAAAEQLATRRHQTVGEVISSLSRQSLAQDEYVFETENGVPLLPITPYSQRITFEMIEQMKDEL